MPSNTVTVLFAGALPVSFSVCALVVPSPTTLLSGENPAMVGAAGVVVGVVGVVGVVVVVVVVVVVWVPLVISMISGWSVISTLI